jgi:hypothetical protein
MAFIIGGHQRSGTTMLFRLCGTHRDLGITGEFRCFAGLDCPLADHIGALQTRWYETSFLWRINRRAPFPIKAAGGVFLYLYLFRLRRTVRNGLVTASHVEDALRWVFRKSLVGDKEPKYVFQLDSLSQIPDLKRIMIYRDGRDVVSSFLEAVRTRWKTFPAARTMNTAAKIARSWVESVDIIERHRPALLAIRYEDFVRDPKTSVQSLAAYLGVDPARFRLTPIHDHSVGKFSEGLTAGELAEVLSIAGDALARLGYL